MSSSGTRATISKFYDGCAAEYVSKLGSRGRYASRVAEFLAGANGRVLDVGCGPGHLTAGLPDEVDVAGFDLSPEMVRLARAARPTGHYFVHDYHRALPSDLGRFDRIVAMGCTEFCDDLGVVLDHLRAVLAPAGRMLVSIPERRPGVWETSAKPLPASIGEGELRFYSVDEQLACVQSAGLAPLRYELAEGWMHDEWGMVWYGVWVVEQAG